jgi:hypothetical protein
MSDMTPLKMYTLNVVACKYINTRGGGNHKSLMLTRKTDKSPPVKRNDKADKNPPVKITWRTKALP